MLTTIKDDWVHGIERLLPRSLQTASEILSDSTSNNSWYYISDYAVYCTEESGPVAYLGSHVPNPLLRSVRSSAHSLTRRTGHVIVCDADKYKEDSFRLQLNDQMYHKKFNEYAQLRIDLKDDTRLFDVICGEDNRYMLMDEGYRHFTIELLSPDYVENCRGVCISRGAYLHLFKHDVGISLAAKYVHNIGLLRGIERNIF